MNDPGDTERKRALLLSFRPRVMIYINSKILCAECYHETNKMTTQIMKIVFQQPDRTKNRVTFHANIDVHWCVSVSVATPYI